MKRVLMKRLKPKFLQQKPCPKTLSQTLKFLKKFKIIKKRKKNRSLPPSIKRQLLLSMTKNLLQPRQSLNSQSKQRILRLPQVRHLKKNKQQLPNKITAAQMKQRRLRKWRQKNTSQHTLKRMNSLSKSKISLLKKRSTLIKNLQLQRNTQWRLQMKNTCQKKNLNRKSMNRF